MANRFTVTEKWSDPWFRRLAVREKLLFMYFCDTCDIAGFVEIDEDQISFQTGIELSSIADAIQGLERGFIVRDGIGWVKNFVRHQRNLPINPENNAHKAIINSFTDHIQLFPEVQNLAPNQPLTRGLGNVKVDVKVKVKLNEEDFAAFWEAYPRKVGKGGAEKAFASVNPSPELLQTMIQRARTFAVGKDPKFIPYPATWLNQKRWEDEPEQPATSGGIYHRFD